MRAATLAALIAAVVVVGVRWGTFVAGGSDSYCYLHQAERWASGTLQVVEPLALEAPWPDAALTFAPAGHIPSPTVPGALVPICAAGLSIAMAPLVWFGGISAAFFIVPLFGALLIGATYVVGARYGARIGVASAAIVASTPAFLFQLMQPMSDVPAAARGMAAVAGVTSARRRGAMLGGAAAAAAIVMRPNLVPLAIPLGLFLLLRPERLWGERIGAAARFAAVGAAGPLCVAAIQNAFYGSPLSSGYGSLDPLFEVEHIQPNALRYATWLSHTLTPGWVLAAAAPFLLPGALSRLLLWMFIVNVACYLPYIVFEDWYFLRFLLPTIPIVVVLGVAVIDSLCRRARSWTSRPVLFVVAVAMMVFGIRAAEDRLAFRLQQIDARFEQAGRYVGDALPQNAIVITSWQSGSVRFYSGRKTILWDDLDPAWLDRTMVWVRERGFEPYLLFESREEPMFRRRFAGNPIGALDWPAAADIAATVRIYRPGDRERYYRGEPVLTDYAR